MAFAFLHLHLSAGIISNRGLKQLELTPLFEDAAAAFEEAPAIFGLEISVPA